ncbi:MAG: LON peptidase substrate-binding domain-containing protein [candidate division Zixibacteria bacterium]|nr:LON peptidase substrate-binding domain-containing protein [candidate division Zixibacteria bacterium]
MKSKAVILPIFPLKTVLFPGMPLPLRIFEPRYKKMIGECLAGSGNFGVVLIKEGEEAGPPAVPFEVGTEAKIIKAERLDDGQLSIIVSGQRRFKIAKLLEPAPHLSAEVVFLPELDGDRNAALLTDQILRLVLSDFVQLASIFSLEPVFPFRFPNDPLRFSFLASHLLNAPMTTKQQLLESETVEERLKLARKLFVEERTRFILEEIPKSFPEN